MKKTRRLINPRAELARSFSIFDRLFKNPSCQVPKNRPIIGQRRQDMEREQIRQILNIPDRPFVDYMVGLANLRPKETTAVQLREMDDLTIFEAAEAMNVSETMVKSYHREGFRKLDQCWSSRPWIDAARREYFPPQ